MGDPTFAGTLDPVGLIAGGADLARSWARTRWPAGRWGRAARSAISELLDVVIDGLGGLPADIVERVDAAYPFGARPPAGPSFPYKAWLAERKAFIAAITPPVMPSADEVAACEVARDAIEDGRDPEIVAELLEQAPNRLARKCAACGAKPGAECADLVPADIAVVARMVAMDPSSAASLVARSTIPVPHHARLVGYLDAGPLFTARSA